MRAGLWLSRWEVLRWGRSLHASTGSVRAYCAAATATKAQDHTIPPQLQVILQRGLNSEQPARSASEKALRRAIEQNIQQQNIRGVFEQVSQWQRQGSRLSSYCYLEVLRAIKHLCSFDPNALQYIEMVVKRMNKDSITLDPVSLSMLVRTYCSTGHVRVALELLQQLDGQLSNSDLERLYSHAFHQTAIRNEFDIAMEIYQIMVRKQLTIPRQMLLSMLNICHEDGDPELYRLIHAELNESGWDGVSDFHRLFTSGSRAARTELADEFLRYFKTLDTEQLRRGDSLTNCSFAGMVHMLGESQSYESAMKVFSMFPRPNLSLCTAMMRVYCKNEFRSFDGLIEQINRMREHVVPNMLIFQYPISLLLNLGQASDAEKLFSLAKLEGCLPNHWVYMSFIQHYRSQGNFLRMEQLFDEMEHSYGMVFGETQIRTLCRMISPTDEAVTSSRVNHKHYTFFDCIYRHIGHLRASDQAAAYSSLATGYTRALMYEEALGILEEMAQKGYFMEEDAMMYLLRFQVYQPVSDEAAELFDQFLRSTLLHSVTISDDQLRHLVLSIQEPQYFHTLLNFYRTTEVAVSGESLNYLYARAISLGLQDEAISVYNARVSPDNADIIMPEVFRSYLSRGRVRLQSVIARLRESPVMHNSCYEILLRTFINQELAEGCVEVLLAASRVPNALIEERYLYMSAFLFPYEGARRTEYLELVDVLSQRWKEHKELEALRHEEEQSRVNEDPFVRFQKEVIERYGLTDAQILDENAEPFQEREADETQLRERRSQSLRQQSETKSVLPAGNQEKEYHIDSGSELDDFMLEGDEEDSNQSKE